MRRVSEYQRNAAECREMAAATPNLEHRQKLQEMAAAWDMLAEERKLNLEQKPSLTSQ